MRAALLILLVLCSACYSDPLSKEKTNNAQIEDAVLFQKDGYTIHRFIDNGRAVYWIVPAGQVYSTWTEYCGKGCTMTLSQQATTYGECIDNAKTNVIK